MYSLVQLHFASTSSIFEKLVLFVGRDITDFLNGKRLSHVCFPYILIISSTRVLGW